MTRWLVKTFLGESKCSFVSFAFRDLLMEGLVDLASSTVHGLKATGLGWDESEMGQGGGRVYFCRHIWTGLHTPSFWLLG